MLATVFLWCFHAGTTPPSSCFQGGVLCPCSQLWWPWLGPALLPRDDCARPAVAKITMCADVPLWAPWVRVGAQAPSAPEGRGGCGGGRAAIG